LVACRELVPDLWDLEAAFEASRVELVRAAMQRQAAVESAKLPAPRTKPAKPRKSRAAAPRSPKAPARQGPGQASP